MSTISPVTVFSAAASDFPCSSCASANGAVANEAMTMAEKMVLNVLKRFELNMILFSAFFAFDQIGELRKEVGRVVRAGRGLRVILHAEDRQFLVPHSFDSVVIQVDVTDLDIFRQRFGLDG